MRAMQSTFTITPPPPQIERGRGEGARYAGPGCDFGTPKMDLVLVL